MQRTSGKSFRQLQILTTLAAPRRCGSGRSSFSLCDSCDYETSNVPHMKTHVRLHKESVKCKSCDYESKDTNEFIEHAVTNHPLRYKQGQQQTQDTETQEIKCYSCGEMVKTRRDLTEHRKKHHFKEKLCKFFHGNGYPCRFPDNVCIDIHNRQPQPSITQQPQQRQSVIQPNSQYRRNIPCRDGSSCGWMNSSEGCRYLHTEGRAQAATTVVNNDQLKELIQLVQAGLNLKEKTVPVPDINSMVDFPGVGYGKSKSV